MPLLSNGDTIYEEKTGPLLIDNEKDGSGGHPFVLTGTVMAVSKKGVTLAELIIVVAIIGVMTFIAVPRMGYSLVNTGKTQTTAYKIASAIRYARSLAISDAATNTQGYMVNMTGSGPLGYTGYEVVNLSTSGVIETGSVDANIVSCAGADDFAFRPLGNRFGDTDSLTVSGGEKTYIVSVVSATGMVKCEKQ
ncbi:MAG: hypothetical protein A2173_08225 [Planctomycetes bacterium RBG_13_44_8b]|nr:MAG: hypothetical protein A2173_08225 [Planctomycetes bacterium RBG_13_44_8b]